MPNGTAICVKCMIVDDEPIARDVVRRYINKIPTLKLVGEFGNAIDATIFLQDQMVDVIFLDIKMPQLTGTDFVRSLHHSPKIIFTTAHKEYAHEGFDLDVCDYLLKPIRFDRFLRAVNKAFPLKHYDTKVHPDLFIEEKKHTKAFIYLRVDRKMVNVLLQDILYVESDKDYVKIFTINTCIITRQTIASIEAMLPVSQFVRIHRSYIIAIDKLKSFTAETVEIRDKELPIGKLYRNNFLKNTTQLK